MNIIKNNIDSYEDDFNEGLEDIEQMLKPQCEFNTSETLKEDVLALAREEMKSRHSRKVWAWVAAACVAGVAMVMFTPPETQTHDAALQAHIERENEMERDKDAYIRQYEMMEPESFESIEQRMRSRRENLRRKYEKDMF